MPLNATSYLEEHGWEGKGVALDGKQGRGLKKPLALPMKRNLRGLGKDRDRAIEWWDCLFETSAKSINIQVGLEKSNAAEMTLAGSKGKEKPVVEMVAAKANKVSLVSQAKRDYARKMLMSGFVRAGKESLMNKAEMDLERILLEQEEELEKAKVANLEVEKSGAVEKDSESTKEEKRRLKEERKRRREARRLIKTVKEKGMDSSSKKRKRREDRKDEDAGKKEKKSSKSKSSVPR